MKRMLIPLILISIVFCSCNKTILTGDVKNRLAGARGYSSTADITIHSNKATSSYRVKQYCVYPNLMRIETLEPDFLKKKTIVKDKEMWKIYHPLINQTLKVSRLMKDDELILMGILQRSLFTDKDAKVAEEKYNNKECFSITSIIPNGDMHRSRVVLFIDKTDNLPVGMDILDENGDKRVEVKYTDFSYDAKFDKALFSLE